MSPVVSTTEARRFTETEVSPTRPGAAVAADGSLPYRTDIDGLRALAILLVVVYHVWLGRVSGGVDVFLMVSAFFLTASFARRVTVDSPLGIGRYWLRKFRRLLPAAAVTLLGVLIVAWVTYPPTTWPSIWRQTWTSLLYVQNWELAFSEVNYYARDEVVPSPLQHFWSLSVQGQVFILWPIVFLTVAFVARRVRWRADVLLGVVFSVMFIASLAFSISETLTNQQFAYFDTRTRLWEFAAGSLVALALPLFRAGVVARATLGWIGVAGIIACGVVLDVQGGFPGYLALWPVLCTAAVIFSGVGPSRGGPSALLSSRPLRYLGRDAYALYLVHWPVLITWLVVADSTSVGPLAGLIIIVISFVLARVVAGGVENPIRKLKSLDVRPGLSGAVMVACVAVVAVPTTGWQVAENVRVEAAAAEFADAYPGAAALSDGERLLSDDVPLLPDATSVGDEWVELDSDCSGPYRAVSTSVARTCTQRLASGESTGTVVVVGDSHAQQWMAALLPIAEEQGWDVVALLLGGCPFAGEEPPVPGSRDCESWRAAAERYIERIEPDLVFGMATKTEAGSGREWALEGLGETVDSLTSSGADVVLVRDNPRFTDDIFECVVEYGSDASRCGADRSDVLARFNPARDVGDALIVDLSEYLCPNGTCSPVIGNVAVYMDDNHLTEMYATTLAPMLARELADAGVIDQSSAFVSN